MVECVQAAWRNGVIGATGICGRGLGGGLWKKPEPGGLCCCSGDMPSMSSDMVEEVSSSSPSLSDWGEPGSALTGRHWLLALTSWTCVPPTCVMLALTQATSGPLMKLLGFIAWSETVQGWQSMVSVRHLACTGFRSQGLALRSCLDRAAMHSLVCACPRWAEKLAEKLAQKLHRRCTSALRSGAGPEGGCSPSRCPHPAGTRGLGGPGGCAGCPCPGPRTALQRHTPDEPQVHADPDMLKTTENGSWWTLTAASAVAQGLAGSLHISRAGRPLQHVGQLACTPCAYACTRFPLIEHTAEQRMQGPAKAPES